MIITGSIRVQTRGNADTIDLTHDVAQQVQGSPVKSGSVTLFVPGSTAGLSTIEYERGLLVDLRTMWERIAPRDATYAHDAAWGDGNGHSHVRACLLGPSLVVPFVNKRLTLGTWQQVVLIDFDNRPRSREIVIQIAGE